MADEITNLPAEEAPSSSWRRGWAGAGALLATILLIVLVAMVTLSNRARNEALQWERQAFEIVLLTRAVDATLARSEAALGRFVIDEEQTTGTVYYNEWRLAGRQIEQLRRLSRNDPQKLEQVAELRELYQQRGRELAAAASAAAAKTGSGGLGLFYQAGQSLDGQPTTGDLLRRNLQAIADREQERLQERMEETQIFSAEADRLTDWLGWIGVLVGIGAIALGIAAYRALTEGMQAKLAAETEAERSAALEQAVQARTSELQSAYERLQAEVSEREAAEARLRQAQKMEAVGQLTGGIAHDFNNMLAVVVGGLELARRKLDGPPKDVQHHLDNAMEGATRAAALTRRLLAFARSEPLLPEGIDPSGLIEGMADLIDRTIGERITVDVSIPDEHWHVWADSHQLENAVLNLCVNARDAMDSTGELRILVDNVMLGDRQVGELNSGEYVRISVSDTGSGIPPETLERVFEPFFTTKPVGKGTGLGLSQIFGFARQSGGDVAIDTAVGQGTTVSIYLPRSTQAAEQNVRHVHGGTAIQEGEEIRGAGTVVLLVEDDPRVSRSTVSALMELGYEPIACSNGEDALRTLVDDPRIELVITDVMMPEMTGPELIREMAKRHGDKKVLFVTGYVGEAGDGEDLGGYDILRKPFTIAALAQAVQAAMSRPVSELPHASATAGAR
jgi:signal transduction histidine kinase/ActR/RegA family two-component response regulator